MSDSAKVTDQHRETSRPNVSANRESNNGQQGGQYLAAEDEVSPASHHKTSEFCLLAKFMIKILQRPKSEAPFNTKDNKN